MKKNLSIPFNGDVKGLYERIIPEYKDRIAEVYFALPRSECSNARPDVDVSMPSLYSLMWALNISGIKSAVVINSSWMPLEAYTDEFISAILTNIGKLYKHGLRKIIMKNNYYMNTGIFKKYFPEIKIEASINQMLDTIPKTMQTIELFGYDSIVIDRSFNRRYDELVELSEKLKKQNIGRKILVNEGCLYDCPFKQDHDNTIGMCSYSGTDFLEYRNKFLEKLPEKEFSIGTLNTQYGCINIYDRYPWLYLKSPFIRPEDLPKYEDHADLIKISGRGQTTEKLVEVIGAYANYSYDGDIRNITDTGPVGSGSYPNSKLGNLFDLTKSCNKECFSCRLCEKLYEEVQD